MCALAGASGSGMYIRLSNRLRTAWSSWYGVFVAASTKTRPASLPTPCICTRISVLIRRDASLSPPSPRAPHSASISSIKMIDGLRSLAIVKSWFTSFSDSPIHFETRSEEEMLKNVESASVATAFARKDFPVPGGPYRRKPLHALRFPVKNCGNLTGRMTASFSASFAEVRPATSSHLTSGFSVTMAPPSAPRILLISSSSAPPFPTPPFLVSFGRALMSSGDAFGFVRPSAAASSASMSFLSSSARSRYSVNLVLMVCCIIGFFSYFRYTVK
mmetsp:Transcript_5117/g.18310  ORF Transcript_5117/g.18310 Transcript_5117/m.18310 type:complete len:274 (-) Transcript_5117:113-934(-)